MKCDFQPIQTPAGKTQVWRCSACKTERTTTHKPVGRHCGADVAPSGPGLVEKAANFARSATAIALDRFAKCSDEEVAERLAICAGCEFFNAVQNTCGKCGCGLASKSAFRASDCPVRKWPELKPVAVPQATIPIDGPEPRRGSMERKPWEYRVTAIIPILEPDRSLELVIDLLRLQTEAPFIVLVDTGSSPETVKWLEGLRAADVELHLLRLNGVCHPSEPVSIALDVAAARCQTRFAFYTHSDCFLTKQTALAELVELAAVHLVAGHQISPRPYAGWEGELGHTLLMVDQDAMRSRGISWSMREAMQTDGRAEYWPDYNRQPLSPNYPDTETNFNRALKAAGIVPFFTGTEANYQRNVDGWMDHVRSLAGSKIYSAEYHSKALTWLPAAVREASERIKEWGRDANG